MALLSALDLEPFAVIDPAKAELMIADVEASAVMAAPCITSSEFLADPVRRAAVVAVLRGAVLRWNEAGSGALKSRTDTAGPFARTETYDDRQERRPLLWPSEIAQLQAYCSAFAGVASKVRMGWLA